MPHFVQGTLTESKDGTAIQGYQVRLSPYQVRDNIPMFGLHGIISRPLPGAQALVLYQGGDPSNAACVAVNDQRHYMPALADGVVGLAHHGGAHVLFLGDRIEVQANGQPVNIANAGQVTIKTNSKVRIEGDLEVTGEVKARADGASVTLSQHRGHGPGTNPPTPGT